MALALPDAAEVSRILGILLDTDVALSEGSPLDVSGLARGSYASYLTDESGAVVGAIVADLPAALYLGGTRIMLPEGCIEEQLRKGAVSEAAVDGLSEILNVLGGAINRMSDSPHVYHTYAAEFTGPSDADDTSWLPSAARRLDLAGSFPTGEGRLSLLAR